MYAFEVSVMVMVVSSWMVDEKEVKSKNREECWFVRWQCSEMGNVDSH